MTREEGGETKIRRATKLGLVLGLLFAAASAPAQTTTLSPVADSYLRNGSPNVNEGATSPLVVRSASVNRALVRFDQGQIAAAVGSLALVSATLELFVESATNWGSGRTVDVHRLGVDWTESGVTWNCPDDTNTANGSADCPSQWDGGIFAAAATDSVLHTNSTSGYVQFDVTADVVAFLTGTPNFGWIVKKTDEGASGRVDYTSREGPAGQRPRLVLVVAPPTATPTLTPTPTATPTPIPPECTGGFTDNRCIPGGGRKSTDCFLEWITAVEPEKRRNGFPEQRILCFEGDPRCDADPVVGDGACTFLVGLCANNHDPRLPTCEPSDVSTLEVRRPNPAKLLGPEDSAILSTLEGLGADPFPAGLGVTVVRRDTVVSSGAPRTTPDQCTNFREVVVPLKVSASGRLRRGSKTLRIRVTDAFGKVDTDSLRLKCLPSRCGDLVVQKHEECDDGNRTNGDGCNQACQIEPGVPTPTPTFPTPTFTPTFPTATPTPTATATNTATPTPAVTASIDVGTASGPPGVQVEVPVTLSNGGGVVVATSNDIVFDDTQVDVPLVGGVPDCTINPAIGPGTAVDKGLVAGFAPGSVPGAKILRVGVAAVPPASPNANPIPDGELFRCRFDILPGASLGTKVLANTPDASDAAGNPVPVGGTDGAIEVALPTATPTDTPTPGPTDTPTQTPTVTDTPTITQTPTVTNTPEPGAAFCGNGVVDPGEECDDGGACFGGTAAGNLCVSQAECAGGECRGFGGDGCAANCTVETVVTYEFAGAECVAGARDGESCGFAASCVGGTKPGRPCTKDSDCGSGGTCVSECGADSSGCFGLGECTSGPNVGADCFTGSSATGSAVRFGKCEGGTNPGALCLGSAECPGGSCVLRCIGGTKDGQLCPFGDIQCPGGTCGTDPCGGGECLPKTRASLEADFGVSAINVGPLIGSQQVHVGKPDGDGMVPVAVPASSVVFAPVKVPGITCACVRGVEDAAAHGPGNSSSGEIACGAVGVVNGITLAQDHNTSLPNTCLSGPSAGSPCVSDADCGGTAVGRCNSVASGEPSNGPGQCVGGTNDGRACQTNAQCVGGGTCTGLGQGGGFCMGPPKYCVGGTNDGFACFNDAECPGGTCPGVGNFLGYCDEDADCPGSRCVAPDDAACVAVEPPLPVGTGDEACLEQEEVCTAGPNAGLPCTQDTDCGTDGQCATECNPQAKASHRGVCNSPAVLGVTGSPLAGGHAVVLQTTQIGTLDDIGTCSFAGKCVGGSTPGVDCVVNADCGGGGVCASATCSGGTNPGGACTSDADCPGGGTCVPNNPTKGLDGLPCTDDDPPISRGVPSTVPGTTGRALALVADANANAGGQIVHRRCTGRGAACRTAIDGVPFDCAALLGSPASVSGTRLTVAFTALDQQTGDWAVLTVLTAR